MTTAVLPPETASASSSDRITLSETDRSRLHTCIHTGARARVRACTACADLPDTERDL
jgi:hypothetical protein